MKDTKRGLAITLVFFICLVFLANFSFADNNNVQAIGTYKQNTNVQLIQTCVNSTQTNITSIFNTDNQLFYLNSPTPMSYSSPSLQTYNFTNTSTAGNYIVTGICDLNGVPTSWSYNFVITPSGTDYSTAEGITYFVFLLLIVALFTITLYGAISIKWTPDRDTDNKIVNKNKIRYFKPILFAFAYIILWWGSGIAYSIANNFLSFDNVSLFFYWVYQIMLYSVIPISFTALIFAFIVFMQDKSWRKRAMRGANRR